MINSIDDNWRTPQSKISHQTIKRITVMNPDKRDGGVVSCLSIDDKLITE